MSFVEVPRQAMESFMAARGFERAFLPPQSRRQGQAGEVVFERAHHNHADLRVRVYTSIAVAASTARACGEDAIRVVLMWQAVGVPHWSAVGVAKTKKILRTGTVERVLGRLDARMRECYLMVKPMACRRCHCGAPTYADSGRCVDRECRGTFGFDPKGR